MEPLSEATAIAASVTARATCRICESSPLELVIDLGDQCIAGAFKPPSAATMPEPKLPLQLVRCDPEHDGACGLVQLRHTVPGSALYDSYWYRSGINKSMTENLHEIASQASSVVGGLRPGDVVVDVGCNDGTLLDGYDQERTGAALLGVDPSDVTRYAVAKGYDVINDFFSARALSGRVGERRARVITSIAMFYDLEEPAVFVSDIADSLDDDGVWVSEFSYMPTMLAKSSFDTICHEHLEYYSLAVIERLLGEHGLEVVRADLNDVNGGSIRVFAGHRGRRELAPEHAARIRELRERENELELTTARPYEDFALRSLALRDQLRTLVTSLRAAGSRIHIYGASTKGNTILQFADIDRGLVDFAADRNPDKWGSETIGTHIPIISEEESRALRPDYYLVLPWHFLDEFVERERAFFEGGGRFIVPLPEVRLLDGVGSP